jgi:hypothetical protein
MRPQLDIVGTKMTKRGAVAFGSSWSVQSQWLQAVDSTWRWSRWSSCRVAIVWTSNVCTEKKNRLLTVYPFWSLFYTILTYLKLCIHRRFAHDVKLTHVLEVPWWVVEDTPTSEARDACCDFMTPDGSWLCIVQCHWCSLHMHMYMCKSINTFM